MLNKLQFLELLTKDGSGRRTQPVFENSGIDATKIRRELQVAMVEFIGLKFGVRPVETGFDACTEDKHRRRRAVISTIAGILRDTPAELAKGHREHTARIPLPIQVVVESRDSLG